MTLADVLTELATRGALKQSRVPAMKTSLKYLASALGYEGPEQCPADGALRQEAAWGKALEAHFGAQDKTISVYTKRNVRNDIRKIFRSPMPTVWCGRLCQTTCWRGPTATPSITSSG